MPKYAIVTGTTVVDTTDDEYGAIDYATQKHSEATYVPFIKMEDLNDSKYEPGMYIISDVRTAQLIEKVKIVHKGYIYNTEEYKLEHLKTWIIMSISEDVQKSITSGSSDKVTFEMCNEIENIPPSIEPVRSRNAKDGSLLKVVPIDQIKKTQKTASTGGKNTQTTSKNIVSASSISGAGGKTNSGTVDGTLCRYVSKTDVSVGHGYDNTPVASSSTSSSSTSMPVNEQRKVITTKIPSYKAIDTLDKNLVLRNADDFSPSSAIFSIGNNDKRHYMKIEQIIDNRIKNHTLTEDNLYVITSSIGRTTEEWCKRYSNCFCYKGMDEDTIYFMTPSVNTSIKTSKMVIFDQSITSDILKNKHFIKMYKALKMHNIPYIVMSRDVDVIGSGFIDDFDFIFINNLPVGWMMKSDEKPLSTSEEFIDKFKVLVDQKTLEAYLVSCLRTDNCLCLSRHKPQTLWKF